MGVTDRVFAVTDGYVQVVNDEVIVLAERALDIEKVDAEEVSAQMAGFEDELGKMSENDARRAYLYNESHGASCCYPNRVSGDAFDAHSL